MVTTKEKQDDMGCGEALLVKFFFWLLLLALLPALIAHVRFHCH